MDAVQEIKEKISIEEVVSEYLTLKRAGVHLKALCPFHAEKTPSFIVSPDRGTFHCFGCGKHGDIFTFLQEMEGIDFKDALQKLADKAGVELKAKNIKDPNAKERRQKELKIMELAKNFYKDKLRVNKSALDYLKSRALSEVTIEKFEIGFAPDSWSALYEYLLSLGYNANDIESVGLIKRSEKSENNFYDRFRSRIMFPIFDEKGNTVAFSGRIFGNDENAAKYINSPESNLYHKAKLLYGYNFAKFEIRKMNFAILVEGQADLLAMHQAGFKNTLALSGTALSDEQISLISRFSKNIILALDSDNAGVESMMKNTAKLFSLGFNVKSMQIPQGKDPADILKEGGKDELKELVKNSKDIIDFFIKYYKDSLQSRDKYVKVLRSRVVPLLSHIDSKIERELAAKKIAKAVSVSVESVLQDANSSAEPKQNKFGTTSAKAPSETNESNKACKKIKLILLWIDELKSDKIDNRVKSDVKTRLNNIASYCNEFDKELDQKELEELFINFDNEFLAADLAPEIVLNDFMNYAEARIYKDKLQELADKIREAELESNTELAESLSLEAAKLAKKLSELSQ